MSNVQFELYDQCNFNLIWRYSYSFYSTWLFCVVNRRLDEWVKLEQLDLDTVESDIDEKVEDKVSHMRK